jgi:hypothetical protein
MILQEQIEELDAVKRLRSNRDYRSLVQSMLDEQVQEAHAAILNPETTGARLEFARARYVAARELAHYLADKEAALSSVIAKKQADAGK